IAIKKYFAVNKPRSVVSTTKDPSGRLRVIDLVTTDQRIYTVGRLDKDSEGLIIVTNDGDLADKLTHPKYGIEKTYLIQVEGHPTREQMDSLVSGIYLADGFFQIKHFQFKRKQKNTTEIEIILDEGRNREVRRLLAKIGHKVLFLRRVAIGSFVLQGIPPGSNRQLNNEEVRLLSRNPYRRKRKTITKQKSGFRGSKSGRANSKKSTSGENTVNKKTNSEDQPSSYGKTGRSNQSAKKKKDLVPRSKKKTVPRAKLKRAKSKTAAQSKTANPRSGTGKPRKKRSAKRS
ncbi:MAG: pseudouridine synthase, partial [Planctomycetota bacterium]|nr:pseudouridine synthase [Planctomycetota bacterium]